MGQSTNGQICFGVQLADPEGGLPWLDDHDDVEAWWREHNGFVNPHQSPFTDEGEYRPEFEGTETSFGMKRSCLNEEGKVLCKRWSRAKYAWDKANPMPFEVINVCSLDYPMYALAVPGTLITALRGYPEDFVLTEPSADDLQAFTTAVDGLSIETDGKPPRWILSSLWA